ncbi:MAG: type IV pilus secretin PilQ [Candidatus Binatia bacterium]
MNRIDSYHRQKSAGSLRSRYTRRLRYLPLLLLAVLVVIYGSACSNVTSVEPQPIPTAKTPIPPQPSARADEEQLQIQDFSVREQSGKTILLLKLSKPISQYRHFPLIQPARMVLDIIGDARTPADLETFRVGTQLVGTVRFSSAQGSLRLTADLIPSTPPVYTVTPENNGLRIVIGSEDPKIPGTQERTLVLGSKRMDNVVGQARVALGDSLASASTSGVNIPDEKRYTGQKLSFDFKDADIKNIFRLLAEISGLNIIVTADVNRKVTLRLVEVPWDQALELLINTNGLGKEQIGNVVRISTAGTLKTERDAVAAARKSEENLEPLLTVYFNVNYAKAKDLETKIKTVLSKRPDVSLVIDERSNTIMIRDVKKTIEDASTLVSKLDTRTPQILIESNLIETTPTFARALGLRLQFNSGGANFSSAQGAGSPFAGNSSAFPLAPGGFGGTVSVIQSVLGGFRNLSATLEAAEKEGNARIISRPSVVTLNNIASTIRSEKILRISLPSSTNIATGSGSSAAGAAVATEKVPVGIILTVTPQVSSDGYISMNINVKSSTIADSPTVTGSTSVIPFDEINREVVANVLVKDGETIVLGGILKDTSSESTGGVPYLRNIPILGWLFKSEAIQKNFEELMVFITPRIIDAGAANLPSAEQIWREQMGKTYGDQSFPPRIAP